MMALTTSFWGNLSTMESMHNVLQGYVIRSLFCPKNIKTYFLVICSTSIIWHHRQIPQHVKCPNLAAQSFFTLIWSFKNIKTLFAPKPKIWLFRSHRRAKPTQIASLHWPSSCPPSPKVKLYTFLQNYQNAFWYFPSLMEMRAHAFIKHVILHA